MSIDIPIDKGMAKDDRLRIASIGEYYEDLLAIDSAINGRTESTQAGSLLCAKLQEREERIKARVKYLAAKRGITYEEMWLAFLKGEYKKMTPQDIAELEQILPMD